MRSWSDGFAEQAASDLEVYEQLASGSLPQSHRLHYLQMWLEKICKAYIYKANMDSLKGTHNVVAKVLPRLIDDQWRRLSAGKQPGMAEIRKICREIDLLHPQVDDDNRKPENVEYPWMGSSGEIEVPALSKFALAGRLYSNAGRQLLKTASLLTRNPKMFLS